MALRFFGLEGFLLGYPGPHGIPKLPHALTDEKKAPDQGGPSCFTPGEAPVGIEPTNGGFADLCLTTWLRRRE
jgi:hypothetical protein